MIKLGDKLYKQLPNIYQSYDAKQTPQLPLQRFMDILGSGGFDTLEQHVIDFANIYDVDKCPAPLLPLLAEMYGLEFPYNMDEASQRKFIKIIPKLYQYKGTDTAFKFLAREIFGQGTVTNTYKNEKPEGLTWDEWTDPEGEFSDDWKKLFVRLEVDGERLYLKSRQFNFAKFSEIIRPANKIIIPHLALFYADDYNFYGKVNLDDAQKDFLYENYGDEAVRKMTELFNSERIIMNPEDEDYEARNKIIDYLRPFILTNVNSRLVSSDSRLDNYYQLDKLYEDYGLDTRSRIFYDESGTETITSGIGDEDAFNSAGMNDPYNSEKLSEVQDDVSTAVMDDSDDGLISLSEDIGQETRLGTMDDTYLADNSTETIDEARSQVTSEVSMSTTITAPRFSKLTNSACKLVTSFRTTDYVPTNLILSY